MKSSAELIGLYHSPDESPRLRPRCGEQRGGEEQSARACTQSSRQLTAQRPGGARVAQYLLGRLVFVRVKLDRIADEHARLANADVALLALAVVLRRRLARALRLLEALHVAHVLNGLVADQLVTPMARLRDKALGKRRVDGLGLATAVLLVPAVLADAVLVPPVHRRHRRHAAAAVARIVGVVVVVGAASHGSLLHEGKSGGVRTAYGGSVLGKSRARTGGGSLRGRAAKKCQRPLAMRRP